MLFHKHLLINARVEKPMSSEEEAVSFLQKLVERIDMKIIKVRKTIGLPVLDEAIAWLGSNVIVFSVVILTTFLFTKLITLINLDTSILSDTSDILGVFP
jgi:hypothetical protein